MGTDADVERPGMVRRVARWGATLLAASVSLLLLVLVAAALTDRPDPDPHVVDRDAAEVRAYLAAERTWLDHHDLEHTAHDVEVEGRGLRVRVLEVGEGPPVLVVPPASGEAARMAPLLAELVGHRFLLVNLPGGGGSDGVDFRAVDHRRLAVEVLDAVHDHFDLDAAPIVAASAGGTWALWYALERPERVTAGVQLGAPLAVEGTRVPPILGMLLGAPGLNRVVSATLMSSSGPDGAADGFSEAFGHPRQTVDDLPAPALEFEHALQQLPTYGLAWRSLGQDTFRLAGLRGWEPDVEITREELATLQHPVLFVWPPADPFGDLEVGRAIAGSVPDGRLRIAGIGHLPWLDDPREVAAHVAAALEEVTAGTPG